MAAGEKGGDERSSGEESASQSPFRESHDGGWSSPSRCASGRGCSGWERSGDTRDAQRVSSCGCAGAHGAGVTGAAESRDASAATTNGFIELSTTSSSARS